MTVAVKYYLRRNTGCLWDKENKEARPSLQRFWPWQAIGNHNYMPRLIGAY